MSVHDAYGSGWEAGDLALWREYCDLMADDHEPPPASTDEKVTPGAWRDLPPTTKQLKTLSRGWRSTEHRPATRGEASDLISAMKGPK